MTHSLNVTACFLFLLKPPVLLRYWAKLISIELHLLTPGLNLSHDVESTHQTSAVSFLTRPQQLYLSYSVNAFDQDPKWQERGSILAPFSLYIAENSPMKPLLFFWGMVGKLMLIPFQNMALNSLQTNVYSHTTSGSNLIRSHMLSTVECGQYLNNMGT